MDICRTGEIQHVIPYAVIRLYNEKKWIAFLRCHVHELQNFTKRSSFLHTLYTNTDITVHLDADEFTCNWLFQQTAL